MYDDDVRPPRWRGLISKFGAVCASCGCVIPKGAAIWWRRGAGVFEKSVVRCEDCPPHPEDER